MLIKLTIRCHFKLFNARLVAFRRKVFEPAIVYKMDDFLYHLEKKTGVGQATVVMAFYLLPNVPIPIVFFCLPGHATDLSQRNIVVVLFML